MVDRFAPEVRSRIMASVRGKDTRPEMAVRRALWGSGLRYRIHDRTVLGTPDISSKRKKFAIFVDGCFWHGCPKCYREPKTNAVFWRAKVLRNKARREEVRKRLERQGFDIAEIWEHETGDPDAVLKNIKRQLGHCTIWAKE